MDAERRTRIRDSLVGIQMRRDLALKEKVDAQMELLDLLVSQSKVAQSFKETRMLADDNMSAGRGMCRNCVSWCCTPFATCLNCCYLLGKIIFVVAVMASGIYIIFYVARRFY
jgi:hypothetical protein